MTWGKKSGKLMVLDNAYPDGKPIERDYIIHVIIKEFTCLCPEKPDQPDYAVFDIYYTPDKYILELKSLKEYFVSYRDVQIFHEPATNRILTDLTDACKPKYMKIIGHWNIRGGVKTVVEVEYNANHVESLE